MKFLIDANLPRRIAKRFSERGHDAIHTLDLPLRNNSPDAAINEIADRDGCIVVTKDSDFVDTFFLQRKPRRLLLISTGNITNSELDAILQRSMTAIESAFSNHDFVELSRTSVIIHV